MGKQLSDPYPYMNGNTTKPNEPNNRTPSIVIEHTVVNETEGKHTAKNLAYKYGISSATLRTRWFPWLMKAISEDRLKVRGRYTDLAKYLFDDYSLTVTKTDKADQEKWVKRISSKFPPVEVIEPEIEAEDSGEDFESNTSSAIALFNEENSAIANRADDYESLTHSHQNSFEVKLALLKEKYEEKSVLEKDQRQQLLESTMARAAEQELDRLIAEESGRQLAQKRFDAIANKGKK